jgi:hypothetical protein
MPDFTVIEGGGPPNRSNELASQALRVVIVELLRSIVRDYCDEERIAFQFDALFKWLSEAEALERNEDRSSPFPRYLSDSGKQRLNSIVKDAVVVMLEELASEKQELQKQLASKDQEGSDPEWFICESLDIEKIIIESLRAALETWALDRNASGRAQSRRDSIRDMARRMGEKRAEAIIAEALKKSGKGDGRARTSREDHQSHSGGNLTIRSATRCSQAYSKGPPAKSKLDPPTDQ